MLRRAVLACLRALLGLTAVLRRWRRRALGAAEPPARRALLQAGAAVPPWSALLEAGAADSAAWQRWAACQDASWAPLAALDDAPARCARRVLSTCIDAACAAHAARACPGSSGRLQHLYATAGPPLPRGAAEAPAPALADAARATLLFCDRLLADIPRFQPLPAWLPRATALALAAPHDETARMLLQVLLACAAGRFEAPQLRRPRRAP